MDKGKEPVSASFTMRVPKPVLDEVKAEAKKQRRSANNYLASLLADWYDARKKAEGERKA